MEDSLLSLVKSYIASEERLRQMQTRVLKKKIQQLNDELFEIQNEYMSREEHLLLDSIRLKKQLDKLKHIIYALVALIVILVGIICFKF